MNITNRDYSELKSNVIKWSLAAMIVLLALAGTKKAYGATDGQYELDFNLPKGFDFEIRDRERTSHVELGKTFGFMDRHYEVEYRYADLDIDKEHRLTLTTPIWSTDSFLTGKLQTHASLEYRSFEDNLFDTSWRPGLKVRWDKPVMEGPTGSVDFFWSIQPRLAFLDNNEELYTSRDVVGFRFISDADFWIEPFVERTHLDDYDKTINVFGVNFEIDV